MSTALVLSFPWGRYHANPWGRHVNEGEVEIPPSPWRLLRALYAVWRTRAPELTDDVVEPLLRRLAEPPVFHVPRHARSHTRHYYPDLESRKGKASTDRTLDAFAVFERGAELAAVWPFDLDEEQRAAFSRIAESIPYFGRADSLCTGRVATSWVPGAHETWSPVDVAETIDAGLEVTSVLAPELPLRAEALTDRPTDVRKEGLLFPRGSQLIGYQRVAEAPRPQRPRRHAEEKPTAVRFDVLQAGLPPETDALVYTDLLRQAALSTLGRDRDSVDRTLLAGKDASGAAMAGHRHAHYLAVSTERRLSGLIVWAPEGLDPEELNAVSRVQRLYSPIDDAWRLTIRPSGIGSIEQVAPELCQRSAVWRSATPFTPGRYPKRNADWPMFLAREINRELGYRGQEEWSLPTAQATVVDGGWEAFRRYRPSRRFAKDRRQGRANVPSAFLELRFDEPISGPLALGHLSHFGLGLFRPVP